MSLGLSEWSVTRQKQESNPFRIQGLKLYYSRKNFTNISEYFMVFRNEHRFIYLLVT